MEYGPEKWNKIMNTTLKNYSNMIDRLTRKSKISNMILIYYSLFLIVYTLTNKFFPEHFNSNLSEYFSMLLSIIVLVYSIINNNANYAVRVERLQDSLNQMKTLKREIKEEKLVDQIKKYYEITDKTERRENTDFFRTVKEFCKEYGFNWVTFKPKENMTEEGKAVNNYISETSRFIEQFKIIVDVIWNLLLFLIPVLIFATCIFIKE